MRRRFLLKSLLLLCALVAGSSSVWAGDITGTINFGSGSGKTNINSSPITGNDSQDNEWTITTEGTTSFTPNASYAQVGSGSKPATSITFTTTLDKSQTIKAFSAKFGGFNGTAGTVTLKVGETTVGSGSLSGSSDVTVEADDDTQSDTELTVTVTGIAKGVKCYYISYTYEDNTPSSSATFTNKTPSIDFPATKTYSQAPTTAAGYSGTITYSMTANTAGATINASTGLVTVTGGGSVTVKATAPATTGFAGSEDSYTLTVNDTRPEAELSWSAASADVTYGADNNIFPTLTNTHSVPVTYSSTNTKAATINASTGEITLLDFTGTTQIKAIFAGNDDYLPQTVSYTLNVTKAPFSVKDGVFDFVEAAAADEDYGSGISTTNDGNHYETSDATWVAGNVTMVTSGKYRWWYNGNDLRFYSNNPNSSATFSVPDGYVITKIVTTNQSFVSANDGVLDGTTWTGASQSVTLSISSSTVTIKTITVTYTTANQTFTPAKTYTTLTSAYPLDFTSVEGLKAFIVEDDNATDGKITMTQVNKVPAGTGLVLKATTPNAAVSVPVFDGTGADDVSENKMAGSATEATEIAANAGYILKDGEFHPATAGTLAAGKAYLKIAVANGNAPLAIDFDGETTGVKSIEHGTLNIEHFYDLQGRKVAQPTKGLYIVNGRKVVVK